MKEIKLYNQSTPQSFEKYEKSSKHWQIKKGYTSCMNCANVEKLVYAI